MKTIKAADVGYSKAFLELANFYYYGRGIVTEDYFKAAQYYEKYFKSEEMEKGKRAWIDNLVKIYNRGGHGVEKDKEKAKYWGG